MSGIVLENLCKTYPGGVQAVKDFSLEIKDKEFIVLVGPSGCGKSTVLRMIAGLEEITAGDLYIDEELVNNLSPKDRDIAMVFQNYALYPHMTVYKNLAFALSLRKVPKDEIDSMVKETANILGLEEYLNRKPKALSGGQKQRVALGRAMVRDPKAFLLDEPLSNLDAKLRASTRTEITKLHNKLNTTFVYVTHDQTEAMTMADRIVVMKDGEIHQVGSPKELYDYPGNIFVAGFIGTPQMNFIDTVLVKKNSDYYAKIDEALFPLEKNRFDNDTLDKYVDKDLVLGIRTEDLVLASNDQESSLSSLVEVTEHMGSEVFVYIDYFGNKLIGKFDSDLHLKMGDRIDISFKPNKIHLFDKESESSLLIYKASEEEKSSIY